MVSDPALPSVLDMAQSIIGKVLKCGGYAIDATVGNGLDTEFLARAVAPSGRVLGFDIQSEALATTKARLKTAGLSEVVDLFEYGHEHLSECIPTLAVGQIHAVMFNLGYLPGGVDKSIATKPETTVAGLNEAIGVLAPGGVVTVVVYEGHSGALEESLAVQAWASALDQRYYNVITYRFINQLNTPPWLLAVEKRR